MVTIKIGLASQIASRLKKTFNSADRSKKTISFNFNGLRLKLIYLLILVGYLYLFSPALFAAELSCKVCHAEVAQTHQSTPHGKADIACKSCHGDGKSHIAAPSSNNITAFSIKSTTAVEQYAVCSNCHKSTHSTKPNAHSAAGITCGSCHSTHETDNKPITASNLPIEFKNLTPGSSMCYECHQDSFTQFQFNERHRLEEGVVECTSCHDPHNPQIGMELGGFKQSVCSNCHADVEGPFVYEHAASRVEGCATCHQPHGSPNRHMLKIQEVGGLCYGCHADAPQFHLGFSPSAPPRFDESTVCTNCHVAIHGSNLDANFLR